jgi:hypothetical protein
MAFFLPGQFTTLSERDEENFPHSARDSESALWLWSVQRNRRDDVRRPFVQAGIQNSFNALGEAFREHPFDFSKEDDGGR